MANFDLSALALKAVCPNNEFKYDDQGMPSTMVYIPKFTYAEVGLGNSTATFPAFIVNGMEIDGFYFSKYQNIIMNGRAYSLPGQDPRVNITKDAALNACVAKGSGWHLTTAFEWAAVALWCKANGTLPYGNNNYGKDTRETNYKAIRTSIDGDKTGRVATGTGPLTWSHDRTPSGIWDLNGNINEWLGGLRMVFGELQIMANNNAADSDNPQGADSTTWMAINGVDGTLITPDGSGTTANSLKLDYVSGHWEWITGTLASSSDSSRNCPFENVTCAATVGDAAKLLLQALALFKYDTTAGAYEGDYLYANNGASERAFNRGGNWLNGTNAGVFLGYLSNARSNSSASLGFRAAYCELPTV